MAVGAAPQAESIDWGTCGEPGLQAAGAECALVTVPLDYTHPDGAKIKIAISRVKHTMPDAQSQGPILINGGGPGGAGIANALSTLGQLVPNGAGGSYDWIGFDPRGVGPREPSLTCDPNYFDGHRPSTCPDGRSLEQTWLSRSKGYARRAARTAATARPHDHDRARQGHGQHPRRARRRSRSTTTATRTAPISVRSTRRCSPTHVRRMVLDSNVDPRNVWYQANLNQDIAFQTSSSRSGSAGSPSTTASTTWARPRRPWRRWYLTKRG